MKVAVTVWLTIGAVACKGGSSGAGTDTPMRPLTSGPRALIRSTADLVITPGERAGATREFLDLRGVLVAGDGRVAAAEGPGFPVRVYRPDGPPSILTRPLAAVPATEAAALKQAEGYQFNGCLVAPREVVTSIGYLPSIPRIAEVAVAPSGETWIRRRTDDGAAFLIDVFDGTGAFLGTLPPGSPFPAAFLPGDRIVVADKDSMDVPVVSVYSVRRGRAGR